MEASLANKKIWILVGTRPEAIKQAPLWRACRDRFGADRVALIGTGQHRELLAQALAPFDARLDVNLEIMKPDQPLNNVAAAVLSGMETLLAKHRPDWLVVQGDTTSAAMAAIAAFHQGVKVAHNEAGLRSYDLRQPFPEEANRKLIGTIADLHLPPTEKAAEALRREGIAPGAIHVVGNTGIDSLMDMLARPPTARANELLAKIEKLGAKPVLLTAHRRENAADKMDAWFKALSEFIRQRPDIALVYPQHPNKLGQEAAQKHLAALDRVFLIEPLDYPSTCHVLQQCRFVVTDSGGIQEEASTLGVPVVVCREKTERMEAVEAGLARLAGTENARVVDAMKWAYDSGAPRNARKQLWPFGDGKSSARIAALLASFFLCLATSLGSATAEAQTGQFGDAYGEAAYLGNSRTFTTLLAGRYGYRQQLERGAFEFYGTTRIGGDSRTLLDTSSDIFNDNWLFLGAGVDAVGFVPGVRFLAQLGWSNDLSNKIHLRGFDARGGAVSYHEVHGPLTGSIHEFYTEALYVRRYRNLLAGAQWRYFQILCRGGQSESGASKVEAGPLLVVAAATDSKGLEYNRYAEARLGVRVRFPGVAGLSANPMWVGGVRWGADQQPRYSEFRALAAAYLAF